MNEKQEEPTPPEGAEGLDRTEAFDPDLGWRYVFTHCNPRAASWVGVAPRVYRPLPADDGRGRPEPGVICRCAMNVDPLLQRTGAQSGPSRFPVPS
jgi:hypothetical protein